MSLTYRINKSGPSTDPCGTPLVTFTHLVYFQQLAKSIQVQYQGSDDGDLTR